MSKRISDLALDTNAVIAYFGKDRRAKAWFKTANVLWLPVTCIGELEYGSLHSLQPTRSLDRLFKLLDEVAPLSLHRFTASYYARLRETLTRKGKLIPESDLWIAATCLEKGLPILSQDTHFDVVPGLTRHDWTLPPP